MTEHPAFARLRRLIEMTDAGKLDKQIAHELGCHIQYVVGTRHALGIAGRVRKQRYSADYRAKVMAAIKGGASIKDVSRQYNVPQATIWHWRREDRKNDRG